MKATITIDGYEPQVVDLAEVSAKPEPTGFIVWRRGVQPGDKTMLRLADDDDGACTLQAVNTRGTPLNRGNLLFFYSNGTVERCAAISEDIPIARDEVGRIKLDE